MYQALYDGLFVGKSPIAGQGLFTKKELPINTELGLSHVLIDEEIIRTPMGGFINHSENPNKPNYGETAGNEPAATYEKNRKQFDIVKLKSHCWEIDVPIRKK